MNSVRAVLGVGLDSPPGSMNRCSDYGVAHTIGWG